MAAHVFLQCSLSLINVGLRSPLCVLGVDELAQPINILTIKLQRRCAIIDTGVCCISVRTGEDRIPVNVKLAAFKVMYRVNDV